MNGLKGAGGVESLGSQLRNPIRTLIMDGLIENIPDDGIESGKLSHAALSFYVGERLKPEEFEEVHAYLEGELGIRVKYVGLLDRDRLYTINRIFSILKKRVGVRLFAHVYSHLTYLAEDRGVLKRGMRGSETYYQVSPETLDTCGGIAPIRRLLCDLDGRCRPAAYLEDLNASTSDPKQVRAFFKRLPDINDPANHPRNSLEILRYLYTNRVAYYRDYER